MVPVPHVGINNELHLDCIVTVPDDAWERVGIKLKSTPTCRLNGKNGALERVKEL
jgi:hypothetical protein